MELENEKKITLGIFIFLGLIILTGVIFYLGSSRQLFGDKVTLYAVFHNVEGLQEGNNVRFSGIKVGVVKRIELVSDSTVRAELVIDREAAEFVKKDSRITIETQGLMGNKIISISAGSPNARSVEDGDELPTREPLSIEDVMNTMKDTAGETANLASNLAEISEKIKSGDGMIGKLLFDTVMAERIEASVTMIEKTGRNVRQFSEQINQTAFKINNGDGMVSRIINDEQWGYEIEASLDSLHKTSAMIKAAGRDLQEFTKKLHEEKGTIQQLLSDSVMAKDMHQALINIKEGTENMDEVMNTINRSWILNLFSRKK